LKRQRDLKSELLSKKAELLQTSAQDHFAKWAKLRRSVDKGLADLEKLSCVHDVHVFPLMSLTPDSLVDSELGTSKSSFALKFSTTLWMLTTGLQFAIGWWYGRSAVFYLPPSWLGPFTWWMSFPFAPAGELGQSLVLWFHQTLGLSGSVSCGVWQMACRRVIRVFERMVKENMGQLL
jgi:tail-anchored protein insertion receptor